jgi:hypothetical protein
MAEAAVRTRCGEANTNTSAKTRVAVLSISLTFNYGTHETSKTGKNVAFCWFGK